MQSNPAVFVRIINQSYANVDKRCITAKWKRKGVVFESIRSAIPQSNDHDPLWHCRVMLKEFLRNAADIAVPVGCSSLDENGAAFHIYPASRIRTPFDFMLQLRVGEACIVTACGTMEEVPKMKTPFQKVFKENGDIIDADSASALWVLQLAMQHQKYETHGQPRLARKVRKKYSKLSLLLSYCVVEGKNLWGNAYPGDIEECKSRLMVKTIKSFA